MIFPVIAEVSVTRFVQILADYLRCEFSDCVSYLGPDLWFVRWKRLGNRLWAWVRRRAISPQLGDFHEDARIVLAAKSENGKRTNFGVWAFEKLNQIWCLQGRVPKGFP